MRHKSSSSLSAALAEPEVVSAEASVPGEADGCGCGSALSMLMWSNTRATACIAQIWVDQACHQFFLASTSKQLHDDVQTCRTVAAAVLTTLSELRDVPNSRKQIPSTAPMLSCWADEKHTYHYAAECPLLYHHIMTLCPHLQVRMHRRLQQCESSLQHLQLHTLIV